MLAIGLTVPALAQTERGAKLIGISVGDLNYQRQDAKNTSLAAAAYPSVGWFVADNFVLGTGVELFYNRERSERIGTMFPTSFRSRTFGAGISPFVRYYFLGQNKHRVFAHAGASTTWYSYRDVTSSNGQEGTPYTTHDNVGSYNVGLGYNYFLAPTAALEVTAGYRRSGEAGPVYRPKGSLDVRLGLSVFLPSGKAAAQ
ncbi:hypothetical protein B0919_01640 [Hymenobacter sp. CRA2]|nr:hypothetical protein B0919_01640 [Hymenobacter sp. CRA2]